MWAVCSYKAESHHAQSRITSSQQHGKHNKSILKLLQKKIILINHQEVLLMRCCTHVSFNTLYCLLFLLSLLSSFRSAFCSIMTSIRTKIATKSTNRSRECLMWSVSPCSAFSTMTCSIGEPRWVPKCTCHWSSDNATHAHHAEPHQAWQPTCLLCFCVHKSYRGGHTQLYTLWCFVCHAHNQGPGITSEQGLPGYQTRHIQWTLIAQHIALLERQTPCRLESTTPGAWVIVQSLRSTAPLPDIASCNTGQEFVSGYQKTGLTL